MSKGNGGPAFPSQVDETAFTVTDFLGMSLRDWFAGMAMQGFLPSYVNQSIDDFGFREMAMESYRIADAMLTEREKQDA